MSNTRKNRETAGKCILCGVNPPGGGLLSCESCLVVEREKSQKRRESRRESGLCPGCGKTPVDGQIYCSTCCATKLKCQIGRVASGKCRKCNNPPEPGRTNCKKHAERNRESHKINDAELRRLIREHYGDICACEPCGETIDLLLTIDHINGGGNKHRQLVTPNAQGGIHFYRWLRDNDFPDGFQTLCFNCNIGRSLNGGVCPHLTKRA